MNATKAEYYKLAPPSLVNGTVTNDCPYLQSNWDELCEKFDDMTLREELLRGIYAYG